MKITFKVYFQCNAMFFLGQFFTLWQPKKPNANCTNGFLGGGNPKSCHILKEKNSCHHM